jgi:hypothetical protein
MNTGIHRRLKPNVVKWIKLIPVSGRFVTIGVGHEAESWGIQPVGADKPTSAS